MILFVESELDNDSNHHARGNQRKSRKTYRKCVEKLYFRKEHGKQHSVDSVNNYLIKVYNCEQDIHCLKNG